MHLIQCQSEADTWLNARKKMDNQPPTQETTMVPEVAEDNRVGVMQQPELMMDTGERRELTDEAARIIHEDVVDVPGTMIKQAKTPIKSELAVPEVLELEVQADLEEAEVDLEVDQEEELEAMAMSQEVEEEAEAEADAQTTSNHKKLSINQTQRIATVMSAVSKKL